jgi:hypothetical protein
MKAAICCLGGLARHCIWGWDDSAMAGAAVLQGICFSHKWLALLSALFFLRELARRISTYMADARARHLPLVTVAIRDGRTRLGTHIFSSLGVLQYDTSIAGVIRAVGVV